MQWDQGDPEADQGEGTRTRKALKELALKPPAKPVIVAVLDSGVDIAHQDLAERIWINVAEQTGLSGSDDDHNGYVDDLHGWNFLGSRDGTRQVGACTLEVTREYVRLIAAKAAGTLPESDDPYLTKVRQMYFRKRQQAIREFQMIAIMGLQYDQMLGELQMLGLTETTPEAIAALVEREPKTQGAALQIQRLRARGLKGEELPRMMQEMFSALQHHYDLRFDPSAVIGDDPDRLDERDYGNGRVAVAEAYHGTHVAGIIAAIRDNGLGIDGQCDWVRIMAVVVVPDGDERDKDVANGIRYAVDNGARIINASFGKPLSPQLAAVEAAVRYAEDKGVLIVHAAGNDAQDNDGGDNYPSPLMRSGGQLHRASNWIEVGASTQTAGIELVAEFSSYGRQTVDIFAPGVAIRSTIPGNGYSETQGTSMAAPEVAGVAALVWSQYPQLTAAELRAVLLTTARTYPDLQVRKPGTERQLVALGDLCLSGGIVDAYAALRYLAANQGKVLAEDLERVRRLTAQAEQPAP